MSEHSRFWRVSRSPEEAAELALSLRSLRKVAGHIGGNVRPVFWKGMAEGEERAILVDPKLVQGTYPVPFARFDLLVGFVVREALSSREWSEWVIARVNRSLSDLDEGGRAFLAAFLQAAEDIYVDAAAASRRAWSLYLSGLWRSELARETRDPALPPGAASLARMWKRRVLAGGGTPAGGLHPYYAAPLELLTRRTPDIRALADLPAPARRRERRADLYLEIWPRLHRLLSEWGEGADSPDGVDLFDEAAPKRGRPAREEPARREEDREPEDGGGPGLDPEKLEEIQALLGEDEADVTRAVLVAVQDPEAASMKTYVRNGAARTSAAPEPAQVARLRRVFREQEERARKARRRRIRRSLPGGKLDARRLYRAPIDGKVFKALDMPDVSPAWQVCIVADASSSMTGKGLRQKPWPVVEKAFASLAEAARGTSNRLDILAYQEERGRCAVTRLHHGGKLYTVVPSGRTPSGQAILAAAVALRKTKHTLIVHVTDGASNCGVRLSEAVDYCRRNAIELVTIGCGCSAQTRDFLRACFADESLCFLENVRGLPMSLERVLQKKILAPERERGQGPKSERML
ncbi:MAG: vWA domain-containing protein [bacterium]